MKGLGYLCGSVLVFLLLGAPCQAAIVINEILADPPAVSGDANGDGTVSSSQDEFIELMNTSEQSISLDGWSLSDALSVRHLFDSTSVMEPYGLFTVFGGGSPQGFSSWATASSGGLSLNNSGDTVTLWDALGSIADQFSYGSEGGQDASLVRSPDGTGPFVLHTSVSDERFSPGQMLTAAIPGLPQPQSVVPEPSSLLLMSSGLVLLGSWQQRRFKV